MTTEASAANGTLGEIKPPYEIRYRWIMLALACALYFCFGTVMRSIAPLITPIMADLNITYSQMGIIMGAWPLTYIAVALLGGAIIDRWGIRKSLFLGILIISLSVGLRYFADSFIFMFLCVALFGLGGPMISIGAPKTIATWFRGKERSISVGIYMTGVALGNLFALSATNSLIMPLSGYDWRLVFVFFGILAFVVAIVWWFMARDIKPEENQAGTGITKVFTSLIKVRNVQLILIIGFLSMVIGHGFTNWLPKILENGGLSPEVAGFAASLPVLTGILAVLVVPRFTPPHLRGRISALVSFLGAFMLIAIAITSGGFLISSLLVYGLLFRCAMPLLMLVLMELPEVGSKNMGAAGGMYFCVAEIGGFTGPYVMGAVVDMTGEFIAGIFIVAILSIVMAILALLLKMPDSSEVNQ
jgi:cyanate permease